MMKMDFAAIYIDANNLFFQIGKQRWNIGKPDIQIEWHYCISIIRRCFKIIEDKKVLFKHKYIARYFFHPLNWIDFTYDPLDAELDDFFMWIGKSIKDKEWVNNIKTVWEKGIIGETEEKLIDELSRKEEFHNNYIQELNGQALYYSEKGYRTRTSDIKKKLEEIQKWKEAKKK